MDGLLIELRETLERLKAIGAFSIESSQGLRNLLNSYDEIIEHLYGQDQIIYRQSAQNIANIESQLLIVFSIKANIYLKRINFDKAKLGMKLSINEDLYNHHLFLNRKRLKIQMPIK